MKRKTILSNLNSGVSFIVIFILLSILASCNDENSSNDVNSSSNPEILAEAQPDECFCGIGAEDNGPITNSLAGDCSDLQPEPPLQECLPKTTDSYVWSLTKIGNDVWFGTLSNAVCLIGSATARFTFSGIPPQPGFNQDTLPGMPITDIQSVCEFGESRVASSKPSDAFGDHRRPRIYTFDTTDSILTERFVDACEGGTQLLEETLGLRAAGSIDSDQGKVVILAGPSLINGVNMFAFDPDTKLCISAKHFDKYNDCRKMIVVDGGLYFAVGKTPEDPDKQPFARGSVLRYRGDLQDPLKWEEVGNLDSIGANLRLHEGRIFVGTWPGLPVQLGQELPTPGGFDTLVIPPFPGIFMSPPIPPGGLTSSNADEWVKVWSVTDYEPDLAIAASHAVGDLASFDGWLYWGTMQLPLTDFILHALVFEPDLLEPGCAQDPDCLTRLGEAMRNSKRVTSVFRGRNFDTTPEIETLYGESSFPVFSQQDGWVEMPNRSSSEPLFGSSGFFDNAREAPSFTNFYTWTMATYLNKAYLGTADAGFTPPNLPGADLYRFNDSESPAEAITIDGFGIPNITGFRTMVADEDGEDDDDGLYIGTIGRNNIEPRGGWKLLRFK